MSEIPRLRCVASVLLHSYDETGLPPCNTTYDSGISEHYCDRYWIYYEQVKRHLQKFKVPKCREILRLTVGTVSSSFHAIHSDLLLPHRKTWIILYSAPTTNISLRSCSKASAGLLVTNEEFHSQQFSL